MSKDDVLQNETPEESEQSEDCKAPEELEELEAEMELEDYIHPVSSSKAFVKSSVKYEDLHSSGFTLILVGLLGIVFLICQKLGFLPLSFDDVMQWVFLGAMGALFLIFIIIGIITLCNAKKIKKNIAEEEAFDKQIMTFVKENFTSQSIDETLFSSEEEMPGDEIMYFKRVDWLRTTIIDEFGEMDDSYLDDIIEDIYQQLFEAQ